MNVKSLLLLLISLCPLTANAETFVSRDVRPQVPAGFEPGFEPLHRGIDPRIDPRIPRGVEGHEDAEPGNWISRPGAHSERMTFNPRYAEYVSRMRSRRQNALAVRRDYNLSKGPAVYRTPFMHVPITPDYFGIAPLRAHQAHTAAVSGRAPEVVIINPVASHYK